MVSGVAGAATGVDPGGPVAIVVIVALGSSGVMGRDTPGVPPCTHHVFSHMHIIINVSLPFCAEHVDDEHEQTTLAVKDWL
jgi:hypothetical protein